MAAELVSKKIEYVFNKITLSLIKEVKDKDSGVKRKIKTNYGVFDKYSDNHIVRFITEMDKVEGTSDLLKMPYRDADIFKTESPILELSILQDVTVLELLSIVDEKEREIIKSYLYMLYMFSYLYNEVTMCIGTKEQDSEVDGETHTETKADEEKEEEDDGCKEVNEEKVKAIEMMLSKSMKLIKDTETFDMNKDADEILDDDLKVLLENIYHTKKAIQEFQIQYDADEFEKNTGSGGVDMNGFESAFDFLHQSKIGELAKEISQDIDISNLNLDKPEDLLNVDSLFSGQNNALGDIIGKVGNKISQKIQSGELKQDDLMQEAFSMMSKLNGTNSFMSDMMNNVMSNGGMAGMAGMSGMGGMGGMGGGNDGVSRKSKKQAQLRKRLEEKQKNKL
jgi:hypothetical protein